MIKFFRHFRQQLLAQNKVSKYLLYAIGEIVLVVIGILIALQINNWNSRNRDEAKEHIYVKNLERDLNDQIRSIDAQITYEKTFITAAGDIIASYNNNRLQPDSTFYSNLSHLHTRKTFVITDPTYTDLISSGNINLIADEHFKDRVIQYYQELKRIDKVIQNNNTILTDMQFGPTFLELGYYFSDLLNDTLNPIPKEPTLELTAIYNDTLEAIASAQFRAPQTQLRLMNVVHMRHTISLSHLGLMLQSKEQTQNLLSELNKAYID